MDQLFLIEILVDTIFFNSPDTVYTKKQINIVARIGNFASLEIRNDSLGGREESAKSADLEFSSGKSYLFPCNASALLQTIKGCPIEMSIGTRISSTPIGLATIAWAPEFSEMVSSCQDYFGYISPVSNRDIYPMVDSSGKVAGHVEVFVRLSCFGKNIQTQFQVVHSREGKDATPKTQFLFKSNNAATTFQCQRFGLGTSTDAIPVAPVYNTLELDDRGLKSVYTAKHDGQEPSVFNLNPCDMSLRHPSKMGYDDQLSIMERMENKFFNLDQFGIHSALGSRMTIEEELTVENISKYLCNHRDCPAAKKFKDLGIGPLATGSGLGTIYGDVDPPVVYGISHANGTMENYGPYGVYRRPKRPDQPFEPKKSNSNQTASKTSSCSCQKVLRLNGGGLGDEKFGVSPLIACKGLMEDFDKLVESYKKALGPCGQAICPYAQNLIMEQCQKYCPMGVGPSGSECPPTNQSQIDGCQSFTLSAEASATASADGNSVSSCGMKNCPYAREMYQPVDEEMKKSQPKPACGDDSCPYTKHMLGIVDEETDDAMRLLAAHPEGCLPPPALPPIHWDCPDPLPKGRCVNSNCPINRMQDMAKKLFESRSICGGPHCPYAIPPPCQYPTCPFAAIPPCMIPATNADVCNDPNCPLNTLSKESVCKDPNCPFSTETKGECKMNEGSICEDPECPYKTTEVGGGDAAAEPEEIPLEEDNPIEIISGDNIVPCTPYSCMATGGDLECTECPCRSGSGTASGKKVKSGSHSAPVISKKGSRKTTSRQIASSTATSASKKRKIRRRRSRFVYDTGDTYPGVKIGHRECITPALNVPHNMGWLWNIKPVGRLKPRRGWKPGALTKTMAEIIEKHRTALGIKPAVIGPPPKSAKRKMRKNAYGVYETDSDPEIHPKSTLQIKKKDGCYLITMNPLKDPYTLEDNEDPYIDCTPLQFKITKNKPPVQIREGEEECEDICSCDEDEASSTSSSELDIEFTPPAGIIHPDKLKRKKNVVHTDTQYCVDDLPKSDTIQLDRESRGAGKTKGGKDKGGKKKGGKKGKKK